MRNFKNILTMVVGSLSILFYTQIGSAANFTLTDKAAIATERSGSQLESELDLSTQTMVFLLCDVGSTSGSQKCAIYLQAAAGVKGVISENLNSRIVLGGNGDIEGTKYGGSASTVAAVSFGDDDITSNTIIAPSAGEPKDDFAVAGGSTIATNGAGSAATTTIGSLAGDTCRVFKSDAAPDLLYNGTTYTAPSAETDLGTHLAASASNVGIFLLQGFAHGTELDRVTELGYADSFTIPYSITVTSNTASAGQSCGS